MAYEALYTRARPKNLSQLVGQEHISNSLARALNQDRLSHAYLLVGTRGTGKTSTARILAKAINCDTVHSAKENHQSLPSKSIPCNECEACKTFKGSPDNIEFDAASNRSVEDVSRLLSTAYLAPMQSRYKTFIIDEVHMLSFEAVNSILKLIEEPPPNVIFFLATTEFNKVPQTIRSRCQILNFKLIPQDVIAGHIINLAKGLEFSLEEQAVKKIARLAKGSMRDALTLFDQCYSMTDSNLLTVDIVDNTLGLVSDSDLDEIIEAAKTKDRSNIIKSTTAAFKSGLTANIIAESIITRLRDIVSKINDSRSPELAIYNEMIDQLRKAVIEMQGSGIPEVILETALFKFASTPIAVRTIPVYENDADMDEIIQTLPSPPTTTSTPPTQNAKPKPPVSDKVIKLSDYKSGETNKNDIADDSGADTNFDGFDEEDLQNLESTNEDFLEEQPDDEIYIPESEEQYDEPKTEGSNERPEEIIFNNILIFLEAKEENDIIACMKAAKVVKLKGNTLFVEFESLSDSFMFKDHLDRIEEVAEELFHQEIKFRILNEDKTVSNSSSKDGIFSNLSDEDKEYLFYVMNLFEVKRTEVTLLKNDD